MRKRYEGMPSRDTREGNAAYMREWRKRNPDGARRQREQVAAQSRAVWRLARLHPDEFDALVSEEMERDSTTKAETHATPSTCRYVGTPYHVCANSQGEPLRDGQVCRAEAWSSLTGGDAA